MPITVSALADEVRPHSTVLLFGAGSSIPSGAPSVARLIDALEKEYKSSYEQFTLSEATELIEQRTKDRRRLIRTIREQFTSARPTGGLLNIPLYEWRSLFTTNYDDLIERAYQLAGKEITTYSSNFDFTSESNSAATKLFKLHGTIGRDVSDGHVSRLILTDSDYDHAEDYREHLFDRLKNDLAGTRLIVIGHSLSDPDIKAVVHRALAINTAAMVGGRIALLMYERDDARAVLFESKGIQVAFGGIDEFFAAMSRNAADYTLIQQDAVDPIAQSPSLRPVTLDVDHAIEACQADVSAMFNGRPATHADIAAGLTFERAAAEAIDQYLQSGTESKCAIVLGASGVGKTTAARQALQRLKAAGYTCWEHSGDHRLPAADWLKVSERLQGSGGKGALFIDEAHTHLNAINDLVDGLASQSSTSLKLICASSRNSWRPRVKTPNLFKFGREFRMSRLDRVEIERLLQLVDNQAAIRPLIENSFAGFSRFERQRRLTERCEADMFVCLKNIFASEKFDDIILREYAELSPEYQDIYKLVAAMESAGIRVHRQLVIRLLGIQATEINSALSHLTDIISEYEISAREGVYGWRGRHAVITGIIAKYKFNDNDKLIDLFEKVIDSISPTYEIEVRSLRDLCTVQFGITRFADRQIQNRLLRRMMSAAPGERVPRHRLVRNLIEMGEFDQAQTEMRIFEKDFGRDGPVVRYRIDLMVARATRSAGLMTEDRLAILGEARELGVTAVRRYENNVQILSAYCHVGIEIYRLNGTLEVFDEAIRCFRDAERRVGDPEIGRVASRYERKLAGQIVD
jgi:hypothetical protein